MKINHLTSILIISVNILTHSCKNSRVEIIEKYPSGIPKTVKKYYNSRDSSKYYLIQYFENKKLKFKGSFNDKVRDGNFEWFYENGQSEQIDFYNKGKIDGESKSFFKNGNIRQIWEWRLDSIFSYHEYDSLGGVIEKFDKYLNIDSIFNDPIYYVRVLKGYHENHHRVRNNDTIKLQVLVKDVPFHQIKTHIYGGQKNSSSKISLKRDKGATMNAINKDFSTYELITRFDENKYNTDESNIGTLFIEIHVNYKPYHFKSIGFRELLVINNNNGQSDGKPLNQ